MSYPKIELHVHLEGAVSPEALIAAAARNGWELPVSSPEALAEFMRFRNFNHFMKAWFATTPALSTEQDYRELVVDYARRATAQGAVYVEAIFSPTDKVAQGVSLDTCFEGFCDGVAQAREEVGIEMRLTPDITRGLCDPDTAKRTAEYAVRYRDRGIVGLGLGGPEDGNPPEPYAEAFAIARDGGIASVPHAGETAGPASIRGALEALGADRIRHGVRAVDDPALLAELAEHQIVCDVCVLSNLRLGVAPSLEQHPLPTMLDAGVPCTINTDDPTFFRCDLDSEHEAARSLGADPRTAFEAGITGALCDRDTKTHLRTILAEHDWDAPAPSTASA
jgi:aminodeoxyfutalosine deaminase